MSGYKGRARDGERRLRCGAMFGSRLILSSRMSVYLHSSLFFLLELRIGSLTRPLT